MYPPQTRSSLIDYVCAFPAVKKESSTKDAAAADPADFGNDTPSMIFSTVPPDTTASPEALFLDVSEVCHDPQTGVQTSVVHV